MSATPALPSYVRDRNEVALRVGLKVSVVVDFDEAEVYTTWQGTPLQFEQTGMRFNGQAWRLKTRGRVACAFLHWDAERLDENLFRMAATDRLPLRQYERQGCSVLEFEPYSSYMHASEMAYHGTKEQLIAAGIAAPHQFPCGLPPSGEARRARWSRNGRVGEEYFWEAHLCFDGKVIFCRSDISERLRAHWHSPAFLAEKAQRDREHEAGRQRSREIGHRVSEARADEVFQTFLTRVQSR